MDNRYSDIHHCKFGRAQKAHLWDGVDTLCTMWSTGGLGSGVSYDLYADNFNKDEDLDDLMEK